ANPDDPDDLTFNAPTRPSELAALTDEQMFRLLQKMAFANRIDVYDKVKFEADGRLIAALTAFKSEAASAAERSDRGARRRRVATWVLVALTLAVAGHTIALLVDSSSGDDEPAPGVTSPAVTTTR